MRKPIYYQKHSRKFLRLKWVYPVISRRSGGVSIGVNLSHDFRCTFHCPYCFVKKEKDCVKHPFSSIDFLEELDFITNYINSGKLWQEETFKETPITLREIKDITIAGNGEPTLQHCFITCIETLYTWLEYRQQNIKLICMTNGLHLRNLDTLKALKIFQHNGGELWIKYDATDSIELSDNNGVFYTWDTYFSLLQWVARNYDITLQTMIYYNPEHKLSIHWKSYISQLKKLKRIKAIQLLTLARIPRNKALKAVPEKELKYIQEQIQNQLPELEVQCYF